MDTQTTLLVLAAIGASTAAIYYLIKFAATEYGMGAMFTLPQLAFIYWLFSSETIYEWPWGATYITCGFVALFSGLLTLKLFSRAVELLHGFKPGGLNEGDGIGAKGCGVVMVILIWPVLLIGVPITLVKQAHDELQRRRS